MACPYLRLQNLLGMIHTFCEHSGLAIKMAKTKVIIEGTIKSESHQSPVYHEEEEIEVSNTLDLNIPGQHTQNKVPNQGD